MCFEKRLVARNVSPLRPLSRHVHAYIYIFAKKFFEETRNPDEPSIGYPNGRYLTESKKLFPTRQNHSARSARKFIYGRKKGKNAWRTIGEYRRAVIRAYSKTWGGEKKKRGEKKIGSGARDRWKFPASVARVSSREYKVALFSPPRDKETPERRTRWPLRSAWPPSSSSSSSSPDPPDSPWTPPTEEAFYF